MDIRIQGIKLLNFKGHRNTELVFDGQNRSLHGANATGKTSIFDAFTWVLFGKDSKGATQFDLKTVTPGGEVMWKLPHSVTLELLVDGKLMTLRKEYEEKWVKTRGETEETFRGHEVNRFWNDVPCTASEYDKKVAELCEESLFRLITSPTYFNSLDDKEKLRLLNTLEGNTTDEEFMAASKEFADFLNILDGKTLDEYKRELAAKIHNTNTEIAKLHTRLDEVNHNMPVGHDWAAIEKEIAECDTEIERLKGLQADMAKQAEGRGKERVQIQEEINAENLKLQGREAAVREEINADYYKQSATKRELQGQFDGLRQEVAGIKRNVETLTSRRGALLERMDVLKNEYKKIHAETFTFDESRGICQTCKRTLPEMDVMRTHERLLENFNNDKAARLKSNIADGNNVQAEIKGIDELIASHTTDGERAYAQLKELENNPLLLQLITPTDPIPVIEADAEVVALRAHIADLRHQLELAQAAPTDTPDYAAQEREMAARKADLEKRLYVRETITTANNRLCEIQAAIRENGQMLLNLQRDDNTIKEIQKAKALYVESRINTLFSIVRFKMVDSQVNGGERQVCVATVGGVPYGSGLNDAAKINAGLDIIDAFCRYNGKTAPVFVDNAESVNELLPIDSQVIALYVTNDKVLTLK